MQQKRAKEGIFDKMASKAVSNSKHGEPDETYPCDNCKNPLKSSHSKCSKCGYHYPWYLTIMKIGIAILVAAILYYLTK